MSSEQKRLTQEELADLAEKYGRAGEARRLHGLESSTFDTLWKQYLETLQILGNKYSFNPEDVFIDFRYGIIREKSLPGRAVKN